MLMSTEWKSGEEGKSKCGGLFGYFPSRSGLSFGFPPLTLLAAGTLILGCASESTLSTQSGERADLVVGEPIQQIEIPSSTSNRILVAPGGTVTIRHGRTREPRYVCSGGGQLVCQRLSARSSSCYCPILF